MKKKEHIFKIIDEYLFKQVDLAKSSAFTQKVNEQLSVLSQTQQKYLNQFINIGVFLTPFLIVFFLFMGNSSLKSDIETKQEIFEIINNYSSKKKEVSVVSRNVLSPRPVNSKSDLQRILNSTMNSNNVDSSKVQITFFDQTKPNSDLAQSRAQLKFSRLTMSELTGLYTALLRDLKVKIDKMNVTVGSEDRILNGNLEFAHYSKVAK
ncbi:MAG: hypothetical protein KC493_01440 [Bacteriovoracaceae bacterium]|nr:hypothetical protein [Bacteriovoracaceae bacterium]